MGRGHRPDHATSSFAARANLVYREVRLGEAVDAVRPKG
jgi:hypothetical protein